MILWLVLWRMIILKLEAYLFIAIIKVIDEILRWQISVKSNVLNIVFVEQ